MASSRLLITIFSVLFLALALATTVASHKDKKVVVVVEGVVYCQACERQGSWSLSGAHTIGGATVSVVCKNHKDRAIYYKVFKADANGYFYAPLEGFKMGHYILDHPLHSCKVKLVASPLESCSLLSNVNYGLYGAPLRFENKVLHDKNYEAVVYSAGPVAFRRNQC